MLEELIKKINSMDDKLNLLLELHIEQSNNLTTYNDVAKFLGKTTKTIRNYIKEGKLIEDKDFYINDSDKKVFIPSGIIEFKKRVKAVDTKSITEQLSKTTAKRVNNDIVSSILKGVA